MNEQLQELLRKLEQEWAPEILEASAKIVFYESLGWIIIGLLFAFISGTIIRLSWKNKEWFKDGLEKGGSEGDFVFFVSCSAFFGSLIPGIISLFILLNIWNWVGLFDPKLAVARQILNAVIQRMSK